MPKDPLVRNRKTACSLHQDNSSKKCVSHASGPAEKTGTQIIRTLGPSSHPTVGWRQGRGSRQHHTLKSWGKRSWASLPHQIQQYLWRRARYSLTLLRISEQPFWTHSYVVVTYFLRSNEQPRANQKLLFVDGRKLECMGSR